MAASVISLRDKELLAQVLAHMSSAPQPLCADFYQHVNDLGVPLNHPIVSAFNQLLLGDNSALVTFCRSQPMLDASAIIQLFNQYTSCLARRIPMLLNDANQARIALESCRRLSFSVLQEIFPSNLYLSEQANLITEGANSPHDAAFEKLKVMDNDLFISETNLLLKANIDAPNIVVLAIRFEFSIESAKTISAITDKVAGRLREALRKDDFIVQFSMRRWAVCLLNVDSESLAILAAGKIQRLFEDVLYHGKKAVLATPYIGIALADNNLDDATKLLSAAFKSSVSAQSNTHHFAVFDAIKEQQTQQLINLAEDLKIAIFENELELYFQPKYSLSKKKIVALEALLRWNRPQGQANLASVFEVIEKNDLLEEFTTWLFQTAFRQLKEMLQHGIDIKLSINIVPQNLSNPNFISALQNIIKIWTPPLDRVLIEITEGSMMSDAQSTIEALNQINQLGLKLSLDDFGTGYSSLSYLSRLPIHEIKIDQSFVRNMFNSERDEAIVRTIIELANNFKLDLVAEGVEDERTATRIAELGCDIIQGFWISKPISMDDLIDWFKKDSQNIWQKQ